MTPCRQRSTLCSISTNSATFRLDLATPCSTRTLQRYLATMLLCFAGAATVHVCVSDLLAAQFLFFGNGNWTAGIKGNYVKGRQTGINCVQFADGSCIKYELPGITVKGTYSHSSQPHTHTHTA